MRLNFSDLFEGLGSENLRYSERCSLYTNKDVEIRGWLTQAHDGSTVVMLVDRAGACPDCSPAPVAAVILPGFQVGKKAGGAVTLRGRLSYGFAIRDRSCAWSAPG